MRVVPTLGTVAVMTGAHVNVDNFVRAETERMFGAILKQSGGVNQWMHFREPTPLDNQPVIRQNRDTLYSASVVDISQGATLTIPEIGRRYVSVMVVNQDHYINAVLHKPGEHELTQAQYGSPYVFVAARILVDPADPTDVVAANAVQDQLVLNAPSASPLVPTDYDDVSLTATRTALLALAEGLEGYEGAFGSRDEVDPVRHLIGSASGWGGLPEHEAFYINVDPGLPVGEYRLQVKDVPVDAFWSISLYNAAGYFEPNDRHSNSVNSITAIPDDDGLITINFGGCGDDRPNCLPIMEGWNYIVRLYRPRPQVLDGSWTFPSLQTT
jgi:hypothetical protein